VRQSRRAGTDKPVPCLSFADKVQLFIYRSGGCRGRCALTCKDCFDSRRTPKCDSRPVECRDRARGVEGARLGVIRDMVIVSRVTLSGIMADIGGSARGVARRAPLDETREIRIGGRGGALSLAKSDNGSGWAGGTGVFACAAQTEMSVPPVPSPCLLAMRERSKRGRIAKRSFADGVPNSGLRSQKSGLRTQHSALST
jgi:hypothetical protein